MNNELEKFLLIATVAGAFAFASVPKSEAGVHVGIGIGFPIGYSCGYPYYPYGYGYPYGYAPYYASYGYYPVVFRRPVVSAACCSVSQRAPRLFGITALVRRQGWARE